MKLTRVEERRDRERRAKVDMGRAGRREGDGGKGGMERESWHGGEARRKRGKEWGGG